MIRQLEEPFRAAAARTPLHVIVDTSRGPVALTPDEHLLLGRLQAGAVTADEAQGFYTGLVARGVALPMEWERHILRVNIAAYPGRGDMLERLALVEETLGLAIEDPGSRLAFERAWFRISHADLTGEAGGVPVDARLRAAIDDAASVLASPLFDNQPLDRRLAMIRSIHDTLMSVPGADLPIIAELGLRRFSALLAHPALTEPQACAVYDALHSLYFAGVSDVRDLSRFDRAVTPFEGWLEARHGRHARPPAALPANRPLTIAYLLHTAHFLRGNAVSRLITSLARMHAARRDRRILLYAVQFVAADFAVEAARRGIEVRLFPQDWRYDRLDEVAASLAADGVDVVVTEQNRAIAGALFVRRAAPRQLWLDTGFPFWSLRALDWTLSPAASEPLPPRTSPIVWRQTEETLRAPADPAGIARLRATFPAGSFVLGVFVRLVKLEPGFLDLLERLLAADSAFHLVIAGPGDPAPVESFLLRPGLAGRVTFVPGSVDLNLYGPAIDVMCDTFPFIGGNACREISAHGTPVVARLGTPWDGVLRADRNPDLLASSDEEYVALALRLARDPGFRVRQRQVALDMAAQYSEPTRMIEDVEAAIAEAFGHDG